MKIKKRLKYKSTLPKADYGMDPNALSNMNKQAAEETPAQGGGMGAAGAMNIATQGLNFVSAFTPQDNNDGIGMSHKASKITSGISTGLDAAASMTSSVPIVGAAIGGVSALFKMIKGAVDHKRENDRSITSRLAKKEYDPTQDNVGYSFGAPQMPTSQPMFGGQAKYGLPLYGNGGPATTQDSLDVYKNAIKVSEYYNKSGKYKKMGEIPTNNIFQRLNNDVKNFSGLAVVNESSPYFPNQPITKHLQKTDYHKDLDNNKFLQRETANNILDMSAPMTLFDKRITPQKTETYQNQKQNDLLVGDMVGLYTYDPIAVKPVSMLTPAERKEREKKYPNSFSNTVSTPSKKSVPQKVTPVYTSDPKDKRLQAYNDSLKVYNKLNPLFNKQFPNGSPLYAKNYSGVTNEEKEEIDKATTLFDLYDSVMNRSDWKSKVGITKSGYGTYYPNKPKKPIQPVIYQKQETLIPKPKFNVSIPQEEKQSIQDILGKVQYNNEPVSQHEKSLESGTFNNMFTQEIKTINGKKIYKRKDTSSPWIEQYALGGFINKNRINNSLSSGMFSPDGKFFFSPEQYQQYQSFYNPQPQLQQPIMNNYGTLKMKSNFRNNSFFELGGDPRSQSNIEAEQGEAMQHSSGKIENIEGQKHENGGTPLQVQPSHEYIYSDSLGYDREGNMTLDENLVRYSFADNAKKIERKYKGRENDSIVQKTKKLELGKLKQDAEQARVAKEEMEMGKQMKKYKAKYGANLKRFDNSGNPQPSSIQPSSIMTPEEMKKMYDDLHLKAAEVTGGLNQTITDLQQTSKQLDNTNQQLQQSSTSLTKPTINKPLYNALVDTGDYFYEPTKLQTSWGTYGTDGNLIQKQSVIQHTPQPLFGGGNRINPFVGPRVPSRRDNLREAANFYTPGQVGTPRAMAHAQDRQEDISPDAVKKNGFFGDLTTGDKMQLASMLPAFGFNMGMGLRKADVEPNRKNLYEKDVVNIMQNRKFDIQNYLNQSNLATNTAKEDIGNNSTSVGGKMANLQKLFANQSNALGDITTKGQEMNNQYRAEEANTKNIIGEANRAESIRAAGINDQNKARKQQFLAKAFEQMGQGIATTGQSANQSLTNKLLIKSLSEISPDFDVKNMKDLQVGDDGYIVFKGVKTEFKMSNEGKIVMAGGTPNTANAAKSQYAPKDFTMKAFANFTKTKTKG